MYRLIYKNKMKSPNSKDKYQFQGHSEFVRSKLDSEYSPKVRYRKPSLMSIQELALKDRHDYKAKEESLICDKAIQQIKNGSNLVLDWTTKTNFRSAKAQLPRLRTQPINISPSSGHSFLRDQSNLSMIQLKRLQLAKLLHQHHKKRYMKTKKQQQEQKMLFSEEVEEENRKKTQRHASLMQSRNKTMVNSQKSRQSKESIGIREIQRELMNNSKLHILKQDLRAKFLQIRQSYNKVEPKKKRFSFFQVPC